MPVRRAHARRRRPQGPRDRPRPRIRAPRPRPRPRPRRPGSGPAELLRFRERLERAARDLTHEYDELLGRLSYAAMPTTTTTSISFARGAPSLDIIDVEGLREAAARAFDERPRRAPPPTAPRSATRALRSWIADRHGVEPDRVLVTNGSMQADAFLFEYARAPRATTVIVERPTYDRTLLSLREPRRASCTRSARARRDRRRRARARCSTAASRPEARPHHPQLPEPGRLHAVAGEARRGCSSWPREHGFVDLRGRPLRRAALQRRAAADDALDGPRERVVYASSFSKTVCPGHPRRLPGRPRRADRGDRQAARPSTYISPNMVAQSIVYEFCALGRDRPLDRDGQGRARASARATLAEALRARAARGATSSRREGGYFMWVTLPDGHRRRSASSSAAAERGVAFVKGTDFLLEGGENTLRLAYSGVTPSRSTRASRGSPRRTARGRC